MVKAYLVQHTHWDREWYFTSQDAKVLADQVFTEVLDELEKNPHVNYCLDGQTSIIDEYISLNPDKLEIIKKLVAEDRLFVGPWFSQTDGLLVDAESILRNLIIGMTDSYKKYGKPMMVGYLPDTFGFNAQIPTLLNQVGIDNFMSWRGLNFDKISPSPYFKWNGLGSKSVYAMNFPFGYMTGLMTLEAQNNIPNFVKEKLDPNIKFLHEKGNNEDILIPSGMDQSNIVIDFDKKVNEINSYSNFESVLSDYPSFVNIIRKKEDLPEYKGDLRESVYSRIHRSISSVRTKMKLENYNIEQKIIRKIEPLLVISNKLNIKIGSELVKDLWKKVLENQAHDSIGGCVSDNVATDIFNRIKEAHEMADGIENLILKRIADSLELEPNQILLVNTDCKEFVGYKKVEVVTSSKQFKFKENLDFVLVSEEYYPERKNVMRQCATGYEYFDEPEYYKLLIDVKITLPALGYKVLEVEESQEFLEEDISGELCDYETIENGKYKIIFDNGTISLVENNGNKIENFISLVDQGNDGDTYDFSPLSGEKEVMLAFNQSQKITNSKDQKLRLFGKQKLPYDLNDRIKNTGDSRDIDYMVELTLSNDEEKTIEGKVIFNNTVLSHRLRLKINNGIYDGKSIAQIQNGFIENKNQEISSNWEKENVEKPVNMFIFDKSVSSSSNKGALTIFVDGIKEYEYKDNNTYITIFATTGELGKPNLAWRPGRASGDTTNEGHIMMPTPMAQELGTHEVTFAIFTNNCFDEKEIYSSSMDRLSSDISYQKQKLNKFINRLDNKIWPLSSKLDLSKEFSMIKLPEDLIVSSVYPSYMDKESFIIRIANPTNKKVEIPFEVLSLGEQVNAIEKEINKVNYIDEYDYLTIKVKY